jgi:HlyD family secretion protein
MNMESEVAIMSSNNFASSSSKRRYWLGGALLLIALGITFAVVEIFGSEKSVEYITKPVEKGSLVKVVNATGTVQPVVTVQVGTQVSGQIQALYADYNSVVKRGQLLAKIDPRNIQAQVADAQANLAASQAREQAARADLGTTQANLVSAQANLNAARVTRDNDALNYQRYQDMLKSGVIAQTDYYNVKTTSESSDAKYQQAEAAVEQARAQITAQQAQLNQAIAQVQQAKADLDAKRINLEYTNIFSPVDGVVISRNVDVGQTVAAGLQAPLLFVIANDLTHMQVNASVDEADIGLIMPSVGVQFTVDAFPNRTFTGKIQEIRLDPQTVQNVVTYSTIIAVDNKDLYLKPGMTANITMTVDKRENALMIPNSALRYKPQEASGFNNTNETHVREATPEANTASLKRPESRSSENAVLHQTAAETGHESTVPGASAASNKKHIAVRVKSAGTSTSDQAPGQLWNPALKLQFPTVPAPLPKSANVWTLGSHNMPIECPVKLGITDGINTEILAGNLHVGEPIIVADTSQDQSESSQGSRGMARSFRRF